MTSLAASTSTRTVAPAAVAGATVALALASLALVVRAGDTVPALVDGHSAAAWVAGVVLGLLGALVLRDAPGNRLGTVFATAGLLLSVDVVADASLRRYGTAAAWADWAAWAATVLWVPAICLVLGVPLLYPDGRPASRRWRPVVALWLAASAVASAGVALAGADVGDYPGAANPLPGVARPDVVMDVAAGAMAVLLAVAAVAAVVLLTRMRRTPRPDRARLAWFASAMLLLVADFAVDWVWLGLLVQCLAWLCLGVGVVRHGLFDVEAVLSRSIVYLVLTGAGVAAYLVASTLAGAGLGAAIGPAVVAAAVVLVVAAGRDRLQQWVDQLLYGERSDPLTALTTLGDRLAGTLEPDAVLPAVVEAVRVSLRLPFAAVVLAGDPAPAHASGTLAGAAATYPLTYGGQPAGSLVVGLRRGERRPTTGCSASSPARWASRRTPPG